MKYKKFGIFILISTFLFVYINTFNIDAVKVVNMNIMHAFAGKGTNLVRNYNEFYLAVKKAVSSRKSSVKIYAERYTSSKYDINKALKKAILDTFDSKYIVSSAHVSIISTAKKADRTINITFNYYPVDGVARNHSDFYNLLKNAASGRKSSVSIKINDSMKDILSKEFTIKYEINKILPSNSQIDNFSIKRLKAANSNIGVLIYSISYRAVSNSSNSSSSYAVTTNEDLFNALRSAVDRCNSTVSINLRGGDYINEFDLLSNDVEKDVYKINEDMAGMDYVTNWETYTDGSERNIKISIKYAFSKDDILKKRDAFVQKEKEIISDLIKPGMTDFQKELAIHDYIINNSKYDEDDYERGSIPEDSYTGYGVLVNGSGVCEGYAGAMNALLNMAGVETITVTGTANNGSEVVDHAWNIVKLGGDYYQVDVTWDDPVYYVNGQRRDVLKYDYFNITDNQMAKDHTWDTSKYPKCNATQYRYDGN